MRPGFTNFLALFVATAAGIPSFRGMHVLEQRLDVPDGFVKSAPAPGTDILNLRLALKQANITGLQQMLLDISTPGHALYGRSLTNDEIKLFAAPAPETTSLVQEWLASNGITPNIISLSGDWIKFSIPVSQANTLLEAEFTIFNHPETGKQYTRTLAYSIPAALQGHIDLIHPTISFENPFGSPLLTSPKVLTPPAPRAMNLECRAVPASCNTAITPSCLQALYEIPTTLATQCTNQLAISGFSEEFANQADLTRFITKFRPDLVSLASFQLEILDDGQNLQTAAEAGIEANLNMQYTIGLASGVPTTFISVGSDVQDGALGGFLDMINFLLELDSPPQVLTTSYGQNENTISAALAINLCNAYMMLGTKRTSILFSSGDGGVAGYQTTKCTTSFLPTFPSGCPFLTSVGGTTGNTETAATFSSGGFSNFFARPSYQTAAVTKYLTELGTTNAGKFNTSGRAFPDVSAQAENVQIVLDGEIEAVSGTDCASPIFASVISLLNDQLLSVGQPALGFLNPFLYSAAGEAALNDITTGSNPGCGTNGFPAKAGWDPVTGLGTPNFAKLLTAVGL